jgi:hypothetical protein
LVSVVVVTWVVVVFGAATGATTGAGVRTVSCTTTTVGAGGSGAGGGVVTTTTGAGAGAGFKWPVATPSAAPLIASGVPVPVILILVTVRPWAPFLTFFLTSTVFFVVSWVWACAVWAVQMMPAINIIKLIFLIVMNIIIGIYHYVTLFLQYCFLFYLFNLKENKYYEESAAIIAVTRSCQGGEDKNMPGRD